MCSCVLWIFKEKSGKKKPQNLEDLPGAAPAWLGTWRMEGIEMVFQVLIRNGEVCPAEEYPALKYGQKCCWTLGGILDPGCDSCRALGKTCPVPSGIPSAPSSFFVLSPLLPRGRHMDPLALDLFWKDEIRKLWIIFLFLAAGAGNLHGRQRLSGILSQALDPGVSFLTQILP